MPHARLLKTAQILATASALTLICLQGAAALAQTTSLGASLGTTAGSGSLGVSLGGGSASGGATANGPFSSTGSVSVHMGRGSGSSTGSSLTIGNTRNNFTAAFSRNQSTGTLSIQNGDTAPTTGIGTAGAPIGGGVMPSQPATSARPGSAASLAAAVTDLAPEEQRKLARKCTSVLAAPQRYDTDMIAICKVLSSL